MEYIDMCIAVQCMDFNYGRLAMQRFEITNNVKRWLTLCSCAKSTRFSLSVTLSKSDWSKNGFFFQIAKLCYLCTKQPFWFYIIIEIGYLSLGRLHAEKNRCITEIGFALATLVLNCFFQNTVDITMKRAAIRMETIVDHGAVHKLLSALHCHKQFSHCFMRFQLVFMFFMKIDILSQALFPNFTAAWTFKLSTVRF